ncbi:MAG: PilZ domain-containing protein [Candidatus Omnitrophota bacterium]
MKNTRLAPRVKIDMEIPSEIEKVEGQGGALASENRFKARAFDISRKGIGVIVDFLLPRGLIIKLNIKGEPFGLDKDMELKGEITHCHYVKVRQYICGIKFLDMPDEYKKTISNFIDAYEKRQFPRLDLPH